MPGTRPFAEILWLKSKKSYRKLLEKLMEKVLYVSRIVENGEKHRKIYEYDYHRPGQEQKLHSQQAKA